MPSPPVEELLAHALSTPPETSEDPVRERVLDAAAAGFLENGVRRTSVGDIARRAEVGRMTVYRRFPQREQLVSATLLREARIVLSEIGATLATITDVEDQVVEGFVQSVRVARTHPLLVRLMETEPDDLALRLSIQGRTTLELLRSFVAVFLDAGVATGRLAATDTAATAEILSRVALSLVTMPGTVLPVDDEAELRAFAARHVLPLVTGPVPTAAS